MPTLSCRGTLSPQVHGVNGLAMVPYTGEHNFVNHYVNARASHRRRPPAVAREPVPSALGRQAC
jgi:hypothetical protein